MMANCIQTVGQEGKRWAAEGGGEISRSAVGRRKGVLVSVLTKNA